MLQEFFAVTGTSVYHVKAKGDDGYPVAEKIVLRGGSDVLVGQRLENGTMVAVCNMLVAYIPEGGGITSLERRIEMVNTRWWGGHSSQIVALFLTKEEALACFEKASLFPSDPEWRTETLAVVEAIGDDHPAFYVCRYPGLCLDLS